MIHLKCKYCGNSIHEINEAQNLVECIQCTLIFSQKIFTQKELKDTYNQLYNAENPKYIRHSIIEYEQLRNGTIQLGYNRKRLLDKYLKKDLRVLEIGSGIGLTGCYIKKKFPDTTYMGIEIDKNTGEKARSLGLNIKIGDFSQMEVFKSKFDIVIMWEVLEHIQDLKKCISLIKEKLNAGGYLIFSVPNYDKKLNYINTGDQIFQDGPPIHLNFFREKSINKIFSLPDYEIINIRKKRFPYLNIKVFKLMFFKILLGKYQGSTLFCEIRKK